MKTKILSLNKLSSILKKKRNLGLKIVHCHGVFDLVHYGHVAHFKSAKKFGDILVVSITADKFINKGPNRPYFNQEMRKKFLASINCVDFVCEINSYSAIEAIQMIKPDFYSKGKEYQKLNDDVTKKIKKEIDEVKKNNGKVIYTDEVTFSSSKILNDFQLYLNKNQANELKNLKKKYNFDNIRNKFQKFKKLKVLVIGELIVDKYNYCEPLGKSGKDPIMMFKKNESISIMGGAGAVANNISQFCNNVKIISYLGKSYTNKNFINKNLNKKIKKSFLYINGPTIQKEKYIDKNSGNKIFGFYNFDDSFLDEKSQKKLINILKKELPKYDIVIAANYGHGLINNRIANLISRKTKFLVVNSQINAANILHHNLNLFRNTTCTIINEGELRHEMRDKHSRLEQLMKNLSVNLKTKFIVVTRGDNGSKLLDVKKNKIINSAAYASKVVDKIGAGDTLMTVFAILLKSTKDPQLSLFVSSIAASHSVESVGNSAKINPEIILKTIQHLMK